MTPRDIIIIGFFAGLIARAIMPGRQHMGILTTTLLGMVGSILGGIIGSLISPNRAGGTWSLHPAGLILSIIGAFLVLLVVGMVGRRRHIAA